VLTRTEVDLIFTKAKPKFERRLVFVRFLDALAAIAEKKFPHCGSIEALQNLVKYHLEPMYEIVQVGAAIVGAAGAKACCDCCMLLVVCQMMVTFTARGCFSCCCPACLSVPTASAVCLCVFSVVVLPALVT
jgi:hypothetical protein